VAKVKGHTPANPPHVERLAQHPQTPSARWHKFQTDIETAAVRTAAERDARDRERKDGTDYSRRQRGEQTPGG
jgi:hypothetical protein